MLELHSYWVTVLQPCLKTQKPQKIQETFPMQTTNTRPKTMGAFESPILLGQGTATGKIYDCKAATDWAAAWRYYIRLRASFEHFSRHELLDAFGIFRYSFMVGVL